MCPRISRWLTCEWPTVTSETFLWGHGELACPSPGRWNAIPTCSRGVDCSEISLMNVITNIISSALSASSSIEIAWYPLNQDVTERPPEPDLGGT